MVLQRQFSRSRHAANHMKGFLKEGSKKQQTAATKIQSIIRSSFLRQESSPLVYAAASSSICQARQGVVCSGDLWQTNEPHILHVSTAENNGQCLLHVLWILGFGWGWRFGMDCWRFHALCLGTHVGTFPDKKSKHIC